MKTEEQTRDARIAELEVVLKKSCGHNCDCYRPQLDEHARLVKERDASATCTGVRQEAGCA
jgi:hypothetical protein